jgi:pilus assembly protein CpaE
MGLPDSNGPKTFQVVRGRAGEIPIVLLSGNDGEAVALDLVSAGAQDYLVKSTCTAKTLIKAILYAVVRHPQRKGASAENCARVVGLLSAKGGVGTTTLACALAAELQRQGQGEVLLADLDLHSNAASFLLGIKPAYSLLDAVENTHRLDEEFWRSIVVKGPGRLDVLASPALRGQEEPEPEKVRQLLNRLSVDYSWIVLDLGRLNNGSMMLLESMQQVILLTSTTLASLHQARQTVGSLHAAGWVGEKLRLAVTDLPGNQELSDLSLQEMVGVPVALHLPDSSADLQDAAHKGGIPDEDSTYRESVARFARALTGSPEEKPAKNRLAQILGWR